MPTADPVAHVETILSAEGPSPEPRNVPLVQEQSRKLSEMMDDLTDLKDFGALKEAAQAEMTRLATTGEPMPIPKEAEERKPEPVKLPPPRIFDSPRQAAPKAPKEAPVADYEARPAGRRRRPQAASSAPQLPTGGGGPSTTALNGEHVAALLKMTHAVGATVLGPAFAISDESARAIGDAALPVLEDFGVAVASRAVHLLMLVSTVAMIEGPIMLTVYADMKNRAEMQRAGLSTMAMSQGPATTTDIASAISQATGVMVGNAS